MIPVLSVATHTGLHGFLNPSEDAVWPEQHRAKSIGCEDGEEGSPSLTCSSTRATLKTMAMVFSAEQERREEERRVLYGSKTSPSRAAYPCFKAP